MAIKYSRVLLKFSGEMLGGDCGALSQEAIAKAVRNIKALIGLGVKLGVVVGGGNIMRGRSSENMDRNRADHMGMLATAINALALQDALQNENIACRVMSAVQMHQFCEAYSAREANRAIDNGEVVVFACGTGSPFFSTDTAAALRALEIGADALLLAKNIDAIYTADPNRDASAQRLTQLTYDEVIERNLKATDLTAMTLCGEYKLPIVLFSTEKDENYVDAVSGKNPGTLICAKV